MTSKTALLASVAAAGAEQVSIDAAKKDKGLDAPKFRAHIAIMEAAAEGSITSADIPDLIEAFYTNNGVTLTKDSLAKSKTHINSCIVAMHRGVDTYDNFLKWVMQPNSDAERANRAKRAFAKFVETLLPKVKSTQTALLVDDIEILLGAERSIAEAVYSGVKAAFDALEANGTTFLPGNGKNLQLLHAALAEMVPVLGAAADEEKKARADALASRFPTVKPTANLGATLGGQFKDAA